MNVCLISLGEFQFEFLAVSYHVFKYCSESACFSQNSFSVLFEIILLMMNTLQRYRKFSNREQNYIFNGEMLYRKQFRRDSIAQEFSFG